VSLALQAVGPTAPLHGRARRPPRRRAPRRLLRELRAVPGSRTVTKRSGCAGRSICRTFGRDSGQSRKPDRRPLDVRILQRRLTGTCQVASASSRSFGSELRPGSPISTVALLKPTNHPATRCSMSSSLPDVARAGPRWQPGRNRTRSRTPWRSQTASGSTMAAATTTIHQRHLARREDHRSARPGDSLVTGFRYQTAGVFVNR
jgi:hypothetical protein